MVHLHVSSDVFTKGNNSDFLVASVDGSPSKKVSAHKKEEEQILSLEEFTSPLPSR